MKKNIIVGLSLIAVSMLLAVSLASIASDSYGYNANEGREGNGLFDLNSIILGDDPFVPVADITGVPTGGTVGVPLTLTGTIAPINATNQTITWNIKNAGATGASLSSNILTATAPGTVTVTATIENGISDSSGWVTVSANWEHTMAINEDGELWGWGSNNYGQIGDGSTTDRYYPVRVGTASNWVTVSAGCEYTLAINANGELWGWGRNYECQMGNGSTGEYHSPVRIGTRSDWVTVSAGGAAFSHTMAIRSDGTLWGWGYNDFGQIGDGTVTQRNTQVRIGTASNWVTVSAGASHTMAINADGELWGWGWNYDGQIGDGSTTNRRSPVHIGAADNWVTVSAGVSHTMAINTDGEMWSWGYNGSGGLGDGSTTDRYYPARVGTASNWVTVSAGGYTMAINADGELWGWGLNDNGQLGDASTTDRYYPVRIGTASNWVTVSAGSDSIVGCYTMAINADGELWGWGGKEFGQLGDGYYYYMRDSPVRVGTATDWVTVSASGSHTMAINADGELWGWGYNYYGQIGDGTSGSGTNKNAPVRIGTATNWVAVSAGGGSTMAINADGELWGWGHNSLGQLGTGNTTNRNVPVKIGVASNWVTVSCSGLHTMAINADGELWGWGLNDNGQLGDGTYNSTHYSPMRVGTASNWVTVSAGGDYTMAINADGELWGWGNNDWGKLGDGSSTRRYSPVRIGTASNWVTVSAGGDYTMAINTDGELWGWGYNSCKRLDGGDAFSNFNSPVRIGTASNWVTVSCSGHTMAINTDGELWGWGYNNEGQLGDSSTTDRYSPVRIGTASNWVTVSARGGTMAINANGELWAWGPNNYGQLGNRGTPRIVNEVDYTKDFIITIGIPTYAVMYNLNGGSGTVPTESNKIYNQTFTAASSAGLTAPTGKQFKEWNTASGGSGTAYTAGATVTMPASNLTLYAIWEDATYTVTVTGGTASPSSGIMGSTVTLTPGTAPTGKQFKQWNITSGTGASVTGNILTIGSSNISVEAIWDDISYTVTYNLNGGSGTVPTETNKVYNQTFTAASSAGITAPVGKQLKEWNTLSSGSGTGYAPGGTVTMPASNITLYAIWDDISYAVTYNLNGGSGTVPTESDKTYGQTFTAASSAGITAPTGKQFKEWNTASNSSGTAYAAGGTVTMPASNITLYAIWDDISYTVTYSLTSASGTGTGTVPTESNKIYNQTFSAALSAGLTPSAGRQFKEWNTAFDGSGTAYAAGGTVTMPASNLMLYAIWEDVTYTVTVTGGTASPSSGIMGATVTLTPGTAPAGKQFKQWNITSGTGASVTGNILTIGSSNVSVEAIWDDVSYTVTYNLNGGSGTIPTETNKIYNQTFSAALPAGLTAPTGKQFKEWNTVSNGSGAGYAAGATVTMPASNISLYAIWDDIMYTVTVTGGTASPSSGIMGATVTLTPGTAPAGKQFKQWNITSGTGASVTGNILMIGSSNVSVEAAWDDVLYTVTLPTGTTGYSVTAFGTSASPVAYNGSYTFQFSLDAGYSGGTIYVNGSPVSLDASGRYTITNITSNQTVTVTGVTQNTPSGPGPKATGGDGSSDNPMMNWIIILILIAIAAAVVIYYMSRKK